jgi:uncharacterized protein with von Willebrand factor type A (vWA) domain
VNGREESNKRGDMEMEVLTDFASSLQQSPRRKNAARNVFVRVKILMVNKHHALQLMREFGLSGSCRHGTAWRRNKWL